MGLIFLIVFQNIKTAGYHPVADIHVLRHKTGMQWGRLLAIKNQFTFSMQIIFFYFCTADMQQRQQI